MEIIYKSIKTSSHVLNKYSIPDSWFWCSGSINPYRGCEHNCSYCDGKAEWYRIENFGNHIRIKINAPEKYEKELLKNDFKPIYRPDSETLVKFFPKNSNQKITASITDIDSTNKLIKPKFLVAVGGGVCDVYQPAEKKFKITRSLLKINRDFGIPTTILTKNKLVLRDLDLLSQINEISYSQVSFSITLIDEKTRSLFEPKSSSIKQRFNALKTVRSFGIHGGVMLMPILPGIGDTEDNLNSIIKKSKEIDAEFILASGLTLKPGRNKNEFLNVIRNYYPHLIPLYEELYKNNNKFGIPNFSGNYMNVSKIVHEICRKYGIPDRMPRYIPQNVHFNNFLVSTILQNLAFYYQWVKGESWKSVSIFTKKAIEIESYNENIATMDNNKLKRLFEGHPELMQIVDEILNTGESSQLSEFLDPSKVVIFKQNDQL